MPVHTPRFLVIGMALLALVCALFALTGFVLVPEMIKREAPHALQATGHHVRIGEVAFNPFTLTLQAADVVIADKAGKPVFGVAQAMADLEWRSLLRLGWVLSAVQLTKPSLHVEIDEQGRVNLDALLKSDTESTGLPRFDIGSIAIDAGLIHFTDKRASYSNRVEPFSLTLSSLSTMEASQGPYALTATSADGAKLRWQGKVSLQPLGAEGTLAISDISLPALSPYLDSTLAGRITSGRAALQLPHRFLIQDGRPQLLLEDATAALTEVALKLPEEATATAGGTASGVAPEATLATLAKLELQGIALDLQAKRVSAKLLRCDGLTLAMQRNADGTLNLERLLRQPPIAGEQDATNGKTAKAAAATADAPWAISVARTELVEGNLSFSDAGSGVSTALEHLSVHADGLDLNASQPAAIDLNAAMRGGGKLALRGQMTLQPFNLAGTLAVTDLSLQKLLSNKPDNITAPTLAKIELQDFVLDSARKSFSTKLLRIDGLTLAMQRQPDGTLDLEQLLRGPQVATSADPAASATAGKVAASAKVADAPPWKISAARAELADASLSLADAGSGVAVALEHMGVRLDGLAMPMDKPLPVAFDMTATVRGGGRLALRGRAMPNDGALSGRLEASAIPIALLQPVLAQQTRARIATGEITLAGDIQVGGKEARFGYTGTAQINNVAIDETVDKAADKPSSEHLLEWKSLATDRLEVSVSPDRVVIDELRLVAPKGRLALAIDRSINMGRAFRAPDVAGSSHATAIETPVRPGTSDAAGATPTIGKNDEFALAVRRLRITQGQLDFSDEGLTPGFSVAIQELAGIFDNLASDRSTRSQFSLEGRVGDYGFARLSGSLNPFEMRDRTTFRAEFRNLDMTSVSTYSMKFAGYRIASGRLSLDLRYRVRNNILEGDNQAIFDQLELGERVDSRDAMDLPIQLAISLLKDTDGRIDIAIPIAGNLDDPQFDYGGLIRRAVSNLITRIITAPLRALAHLFGGKSDEAEKAGTIAFEAGQSRLLPPEREKIVRIASILAKRPELKVAVPGRADSVIDGSRLKRSALTREIARRAGFDIAEDESTGGVNIDDARARRAIRALFAERHSAAELDRIKAEAEAKERDANAGKTALSALERLRNLTSGEPQVGDARPFYNTLLRQLRENQTLPPDALTQVATARAMSIATALRDAGTAPDRVTLSPVSVPATAGDAQAREVSVALELTKK